METMQPLEEQLRDAAPNDWAPWLVFGDWLLERGDARGELIQLEHRLATNPSARDLQAAIAALTKEHKTGWTKGIPKGVDVTEWRHGFAIAARVSWSKDAPSLVDRLLASPAARLLGTLQIRPPEREAEGDDDFPDEPPLAPPPADLDGFDALRFGSLRALDLAYLVLGSEGAKKLAALPIEGLRVIDLRFAYIGDEGIAALSKRALPNLRRLAAQQNLIGPSGAEALFGAAWDLRELDLRYNAIGVEGARALTRARFAPTLERLGLYREDVGEEGARVLGRCDALKPSVRNLWRGS